MESLVLVENRIGFLGSFSFWLSGGTFSTNEIWICFSSQHLYASQNKKRICLWHIFLLFFFFFLIIATLACRRVLCYSYTELIFQCCGTACDQLKRKKKLKMGNINWMEPVNVGQIKYIFCFCLFVFCRRLRFLVTLHPCKQTTDT